MSVEKHISHTFILRVLLTLIMVLQSVFVTRLLGPEGRGLYAKLQASQNLFILLFGLGLTSGITYFISNKKIEPSKIFGISFLIWLSGALLLGVLQIVFLVIPKSDIVFPVGYQLAFFHWYFFFSFFINTLQLVFNAGLSGKQKFAVCNWIEVAVGLSRLVIFAYFFLYQDFNTDMQSMKTVFLWDLGLTLLKGLLFALSFYRVFGFAVNFNVLSSVRTVLSFSFMIYVSYVINFIYLRLDFWLIERNLGLSELGVYSVATNLAQFLTFVPITLNNVMLPYLSGLESNEALKKLGLFSRLNAAALLGMTAFLCFLARPIVQGLYGNAFEEAVQPLRMVSLSFLFLSLKHLFCYFNLSQGRTTANIKAELLGLALGVTLNLWLIPKFGIMGACTASLVANFFSFLYVISGILRKWKADLSDFILLARSDVSSILASLVTT
jgi:O-antigen/teichoic acid export membrane protein